MIKNELILRTRDIGSAQRAEQHEAALQLVQELKGETPQHTLRGRPYLCSGDDVSISHANHMVFVGIADKKFRIGVDVEFLGRELYERAFSEGILNIIERDVLALFCAQRRFIQREGLIVFWSLKEAFAKCLDKDLVPKEIIIRKIDERGHVFFESSLHDSYGIVKARISIVKEYCYAYCLSKNKRIEDLEAC